MSTLLELWAQRGYERCFPKDGPNPETGCRGCGDNARIEYEQCQQSFYLKKQTQLLESQQSLQQEVLDKQNIQIKELTQRLDQENRNFEASYLLNIGLSVILGIILIYFLSKFIRKKWLSKNKTKTL